MIRSTRAAAIRLLLTGLTWTEPRTIDRERLYQVTAGLLRRTQDIEEFLHRTIMHFQAAGAFA